MYQSKLLFSLVTLGLLGCDAPKNQQTEISEYSKDFLMPMAKEGPIHYEEDFLSVATDVALNDKPFLPEYREFCVSLDALDSSFYDIVVLSDGSGFDIIQDGKSVLSSKNMSPKAVEQIAPMMQQVFEKICILEEACDTLAELSPKPKTPLAQLTNHENNRNIITRTRLKHRVSNEEKEIVDLIQQAVKINQKEGLQNISEQTTSLPIDSKTNASSKDLEERFSLIELRDMNDDLYEIAVTQHAQFFEVLKNSKSVVKSDALPKELYEKMRPVMQEVVENINQIAKDEEVLEEISPKSSLGIVLKTSDNKNIITRTRLESRVERAKNSILQTVTELIDMVEKGQSQPEEEKESKPVKIDTPSSEIYLSLNRLKQIEFQRV